MLLQALCLTIFNLLQTRKSAEQLEASFSLFEVLVHTTKGPYHNQAPLIQDGGIWGRHHVIHQKWQQQRCDFAQGSMVPDLLLNRVSGLSKSLQSKLCCIILVMLWWAWLWAALLVDHVASEECRLKQQTPIPSVAYPILKIAGARPSDAVILSCSGGKPQPACGRHEDQSMPQRCAIQARRQMPDMPYSWAVLAGDMGMLLCVQQRREN